MDELLPCRPSSRQGSLVGTAGSAASHGGRPECRGWLRPTSTLALSTPRRTTRCSRSTRACRLGRQTGRSRFTPDSRNCAKRRPRCAGDRHLDTLTEVLWSALHGLVTLMRAGRLRENQAGLRLPMLVAQLQTLPPSPAGVTPMARFADVDAYPDDGTWSTVTQLPRHDEVHRERAVGRPLTREAEVAALVSRGLSNMQIASNLDITERTAGPHRTHPRQARVCFTDPDWRVGGSAGLVDRGNN